MGIVGGIKDGWAFSIARKEGGETKEEEGKTKSKNKKKKRKKERTKINGKTHRCVLLYRIRSLGIEVRLFIDRFSMQFAKSGEIYLRRLSGATCNENRLKLKSRLVVVKGEGVRYANES